MNTVQKQCLVKIEETVFNWKSYNNVKYASINSAGVSETISFRPSYIYCIHNTLYNRIFLETATAPKIYPSL